MTVKTHASQKRGLNVVEWLLRGTEGDERIGQKKKRKKKSFLEPWTLSQAAGDLRAWTTFSTTCDPG